MKQVWNLNQWDRNRCNKLVEMTVMKIAVTAIMIMKIKIIKLKSNSNTSDIINNSNSDYNCNNEKEYR